MVDSGDHRRRSPRLRLHVKLVVGAVASAATLRDKLLSQTQSIDFWLVRNQPIEAVHNYELNLTLLGFEIQTELLPKCGKDRIREAIGCC
jgi:hypothetical protein